MLFIDLTYIYDTAAIKKLFDVLDQPPFNKTYNKGCKQYNN